MHWLLIASFKSKTLELCRIKNKTNLLENDGKLFHQSKEDQIALDENAVFFDLTTLMEHSSIHGSTLYPLGILANLKSHPSLQAE